MEILETSYEEYVKSIWKPDHFFNTATFNYLNESKCEQTFFLLFNNGKVRLGIIGGIRDNKFLSPFSAPFGGFSFVDKDVKISYIEESIDLLIEWCKKKMINEIKITLPPQIYNPTFIAKQLNCFFRKHFNIEYIDLNYSFSTNLFDQNYENNILWRNARKNLKAGMANKLNFVECKTEEQKSDAYNIIQKNRESRGFPLRMTLEQLFETIQFVNHDFFLVETIDLEKIASAIVYHVNEDIVMIIYWGDLPEFSGMKTMNYLSYKVFEFYKSLGKSIVDIGPSTEYSDPNYGLCEFKESLGATVHTKVSFSYLL